MDLLVLFFIIDAQGLRFYNRGTEKIMRCMWAFNSIQPIIAGIQIGLVIQGKDCYGC